MLQKRKAIGWNFDLDAYPGLGAGKKSLETVYQSMDLELDASDANSRLIVSFEESDFFQDQIQRCRYIVNPLYNDRTLLDREIVNNLISSVLYFSKYL